MSNNMQPPLPPTAQPPPSPPPPDEIVLPSNPAEPAPILRTEQRVATWPSTPGYRGFIGWLKDRCASIKGAHVVEGNDGASENIGALLNILDSLYAWVDEVPPQAQSAQRFGNLAFRKYIALVEERLPPLISASSMPPTLIAQVMPLFIQSHPFGHPTRIDYGTGHELAFALILWCCVVSGWITSDDEDALILRVFPRYLDLTTKLQVVYRLEPAGSHGVWGLDDYCFLPYLFGSAQLKGSDVSPEEALRNATTSSGPFTDMYTLSLHRISLFKKGAAFREHSPLLHSLSQFPDWVKPHGGLLKMYQAEVLGKRVVVQGLWIGGWCWGEDFPEDAKPEDPSSASTTAGPTAQPWAATTAAPWASTAAPWASSTAIPKR